MVDKKTPRMGRKIIKMAINNRRAPCRMITNRMTSKEIVMSPELLEVGLKAYHPIKEQGLIDK